MGNPRSLIDYFAAHAPPCPDWFEGPTHEKPVQPDIDKVPADWRPEVRRWMQDPDNFPVPPVALEDDHEISDRVNKFVQSVMDWREAVEAWEVECELQRFFHWRWFYAEMMVASRSAATSETRKEARNARTLPNRRT